MTSDGSCPICLGDGLPMARGKCRHEYCIPCFHKLFRLSTTVPPPSSEGEDSSSGLLSESSHPPPDVDQQPLEMENFPQDVLLNKIGGLAACPICRLLIQMDDVRSVTNGSKVWKKVIDLQKSPLAGLAFLGREGQGRKYSFHFPHPVDQTSHDSTTPYVRVSDYCSEETGVNENTFHFEKGCYYMPLSRTFHGRFYLTDSFECQEKPHDVLLVFSPDHGWISNGMILRHNHLLSERSTFKCEEKFPLDGEWLVEWFPSKPWENEDQESVEAMANAYVTVSANVLLADEISYQLQFDETKGIHFRWHVNGVEQVLDPSSDFRDLRTEQDKPKVGDKLRWKTTDSAFPCIVWTRETVETDLPPPASTSFLFPPVRGNTTKYSSSSSSSSPSHQSIADDGINNWTNGLPVTFQHVSDQLWGNTFCQLNCVGLASYHFCQDQSAYISYEHFRANGWPPLDDDSPIPIRCRFRNVSYEPGNGNNKSAIFRGSIHWLEDFGTTWMSHQRWEYEMHFDPHFRIISAGKVDCVSATGVTSNMSTFGDNLKYVNAAI